MRSLRGPWRRWAMDCLCLLAASVGGAFIRFGWAAGRHVFTYLLVALASSALLAILGFFPGLYRGRFKPGSFDELRNLGLAVGVTALLLSAVLLPLPESAVPKSAAAVTGLLGLVLMVGWRTFARWARERRGLPVDADPVVLFGAGDAGEQLLRAMRRDPRSPYRVVALLDDDPKKRNLRLEGTPVVGTREVLGEVVAHSGARIVIVSIARADSALLADLAHRCELAGVRMLVLPPVSQFVHERVEIADVRGVDETDLLGRAPVEIDTDSIAALLAGQRVLITGAGGSIGSELARRISRFDPAELMLLDRDESALHAIELEIRGTALLDREDVILADIRDRDRIVEVFLQRRPTVVFHAAALKHLPLLEAAPAEAVKTNVSGTRHVLDAAAEVGVRLFVNVSTDKAANPISVLGYSKRIAERMTSLAAEQQPGSYVSVRFGNVLGSRGSVLITFADQIRRGGPVTVTHPAVTRYFMTIPEAVLLVLQAVVHGRSGEVLILDMGEPVRIQDVARQMIDFSGRDIPIRFTGLRPGEKLDEELLGNGEVGVRSAHPKIMRVAGSPLKVGVGDLESSGPSETVRTRLREISLRG